MYNNIFTIFTASLFFWTVVFVGAQRNFVLCLLLFCLFILKFSFSFSYTKESRKWSAIKFVQSQRIRLIEWRDFVISITKTCACECLHVFSRGGNINLLIRIIHTQCDRSTGEIAIVFLMCFGYTVIYCGQ